MHLKPLLLISMAILGQACIELPEVDNPDNTGEDNPSNNGDAGMTPQKHPPEVVETRQTSSSTPGGGVITLHIGARDPQNSLLRFSWEANAGTLDTQSSTTTSSEVVWTAPTCGSAPPEARATITATVTNALGLSTSASFNVKGTCYPPELTETQQSAIVVSDGATVTLQLTARDPQSSALSFDWHSTGGSLGTPTNSNTVSEIVWAAPTCSSSSPKEATTTITGTVTNALGLSTSASFNVTASCPKWLPTQAMASARSAHTATLLPSGKVLVTGGATNIATAELYDPTTGTWSSTNSMASARYFHAATLLNSGKVLVTGGTSDGTTFLQTAEVYDPATGTWSSTGSLAAARYRHTATLLPSGKVLVTGGYRGSGDPTAAEIYDPSNGTWASAGNMPAIRTGHTATVLDSGEVLVAGYGSADLYNPTTGTWKPTPTRMVFDRNGHTATRLPSGKVLVTGGVNSNITYSTAEVYDPTTGTWSSTGSMESARTLHTAILLSSGKVMATGGFQDSNSASKSATVELYDPDTGTWSPTISTLAAHALHTATLLQSNRVLIVGGSNNPMAEVYEP